MSSLTKLVEEILTSAKRIDEYTSSKNIPLASFDHDSFANLPPDVEATRRAMIDSMQILRKLVSGPIAMAAEILHSPTDMAVLRIIYTYKLPHAVPLNGSATYADIARTSGLSESTVYRFLRHAMANHIFAESSPGHVCHTAVSRMMVEDPDFFDDVGMHTCEVGPALMKVPDALVKYPDSGEQSETAFALCNDTELSVYGFFADKPERARRFGASMKFMTKGEAFNIKHLTSSYDWAALDRQDTVLVDVGGGHGAVSQFLASSTKNMKFIVQDLPSTVERAREILPAEYRSRIDFVGHDFFTEQSVKGANIYFLRWVFHNLSDQYCLQILKNLVPAMRDGTKILVYEIVLPESPQTTWAYKLSLDIDMVMAASFNGRERNITDWRKLFETADQRFVFRSVTDTPGSSLNIIEVVWEDPASLFDSEF